MCHSSRGTESEAEHRKTARRRLKTGRSLASKKNKRKKLQALLLLERNEDLGYIEMEAPVKEESKQASPNLYVEGGGVGTCHNYVKVSLANTTAFFSKHSSMHEISQNFNSESVSFVSRSLIFNTD